MIQKRQTIQGLYNSIFEPDRNLSRNKINAKSKELFYWYFKRIFYTQISIKSVFIKLSAIYFFRPKPQYY